jgi:2-polyprenyl-3-methyl-5-hydroxy-6-metoxy-1,4-benzoquinol methylase
MNENIDALKEHPSSGAKLTYRLRNADVYVSAQGFHFIDTLDPLADLPPEVDASQLTGEAAAYIETQLQANERKFIQQVEVLKRHLPIQNARVLDIGCGGGLFLSLLKEQGADVTLASSSATAAPSMPGPGTGWRSINAPSRTTSGEKDRAGQFEAVTLWDVIEHVNYPFQTVQSAVDVLKPGGLLLIDTPCRDSFYHRFGEFTYKATRGRYPTFLNAMYSSHLFGHKQIFATWEMKELFEAAGLEVLELRKFHELSFPYEFYLKKLFRSETAVRLSLPIVNLFFKIFKIQNKMLVVGRKR